MQKNGIIRTSNNTFGWTLSVVSASKTRKLYTGNGFKTSIEAAYDYVKAVIKYDPKAAIMLKDKTAEEQFQLLGIKL
jgi:hypothetical protein